MDKATGWHGRIKPPIPVFTSMEDVKHAVMKMDSQQGSGPWWVWGDGVEPLLKEVDFDTMKSYVDEGHTKGQLDLYGDNVDDNIQYEGEE